MINCTFENGNQNSLRHVAAICIAVKDGEVLLARRHPDLSEGGKWSIPGGYVNRDETALEGAVREVREETGWDVTDVRLFRINDNPDRPDSDRQTIDFIFTATAAEKIGKPDWETSELGWFSFDALPPHDEISFDHSDSLQLFADRSKQSQTEVLYYGAI